MCEADSISDSSSSNFILLTVATMPCADSSRDRFEVSSPNCFESTRAIGIPCSLASVYISFRIPP